MGLADGMAWEKEYGTSNERRTVMRSPEKKIGMRTGLFDKTGSEILVGDQTKLVLDDGEIRIFTVEYKTVKRKVQCLPGFDDDYAIVNITGIVFCWDGHDLFPCVDESGVSDVSKMEIIASVPLP